MKRLCTVMLVVLLASFSPASSVDCTENCQSTPLSIQSSTSQAKTLTFAIRNDTSQSQPAYIRGVVQSGGEEIYFYGAINVGPNGITLFQTTFEKPINVLSCQLVCANIPTPDGMNEGPDPIVKEFEDFGEAPPPGGGQGGGNS